MDIYRVYKVDKRNGQVDGLSNFNGFLRKEQAMDYARKLFELTLDRNYYYIVVKETVHREAILNYEWEEWLDLRKWLLREGD